MDQALTNDDLYVIKNVDERLVARRRFSPAVIFVYEVELDGNIYILKVASSLYPPAEKHLEGEGKLLKRAQEVKGITHLVHDYGKSGYYSGLLKEFFEGDRLGGSKISDTNLQKKLEETVRDLHSLRISDLDMNGFNVVISPNEEDVRLIELGGAKHFGWYRPDFHKKTSDDLFNLECLFI